MFHESKITGQKCKDLAHLLLDKVITSDTFILFDMKRAFKAPTGIVKEKHL